jgi:hypothetical protein
MIHVRSNNRNKSILMSNVPLLECCGIAHTMDRSKHHKRDSFLPSLPPHVPLPGGGCVC